MPSVFGKLNLKDSAEILVLDSSESFEPALTKGDAIVWFAYPKGTSKKYRCDFNRDTGWVALAKFGFEGVRQIAIDEDRTALRFRRVEFIKTMTRDASRVRTRVGKKRAAEK